MELINNLTSNEDMRQDLWVAYLSDRSSNLIDHLRKFYNKNRIDRRLQRELWQIADTSSVERLSIFLSNFSDFEQSIMALLILGLSIEEVGRQKDMKIVRVRQAIAAIRSSNAWDQFKVGE